MMRVPQRRLTRDVQVEDSLAAYQQGRRGSVEALMGFNEALTAIRSTSSGDDKGDSVSDSMWIELLDALNVPSNHITVRAELAVRKFLYYGLCSTLPHTALCPRHCCCTL